MNIKKKLNKNVLSEMIYTIDRINQNKIHCIDGRKILDSSGEAIMKYGLSYPGGQIGVFATILSVFDNIDYIEKKLGSDYRIMLRNIVKSFFMGELTYHSFDSCTGKNIGCGHLDLIKNKDRKYYLTKKSVDIILETINDCPKNNVEILTGEHEEKALIILKGEPGFGIKNFDKNGNSYFTLTRATNEKLLFDLSQYIIAKLNNSFIDSPKLLYDLIVTSKDYQLNTTVGYLAPDLPVIRIFLNPIGKIEVIKYY